MQKKQIGSMFRPIADILKDFNSPIDPNLISQKPVYRKGESAGSVSFVHWYDLIEELCKICPGYSWEIRTQFLPDRCVIEGRLTIRALEGEFYMESTGVEMLDSNGFGDPVYSAESSALRRAMAKYGYGLDLWKKDKPNYSDSPRTHVLRESPIKNVQDLNNKLVTQKQLTLLCTIASERGLDIESDVKAIIQKYGYESKKQISQDNLDKIIAEIKTAGRFVTIAQRKELMDWWRIEGIQDEQVKQVLERTGYNSTAQIPRDQINSVKSEILRDTKMSVSYN